MRLTGIDLRQRNSHSLDRSKALKQAMLFFFACSLFTVGPGTSQWVNSVETSVFTDNGDVLKCKAVISVPSMAHGESFECQWLGVNHDFSYAIVDTQACEAEFLGEFNGEYFFEVESEYTPVWAYNEELEDVLPEYPAYHSDIYNVASGDSESFMWFHSWWFWGMAP